MTPPSPLVAQRHPGGCGISCLASWCGLSYEDVYVAAVAVHPRIPQQGANVVEMLAIAKRLGRVFTRLDYRKVDVEESEGILGVNWNVPKAHGGAKGHWVLLRRGLIIDLDGTPAQVADADEYLLAHKGRAGTLLVPAA